jgi:hypothetical protein
MRQRVTSDIHALHALVFNSEVDLKNIILTIDTHMTQHQIITRQTTAIRVMSDKLTHKASIDVKD